MVSGNEGSEGEKQDTYTTATEKEEFYDTSMNHDTICVQKEKKRKTKTTETLSAKYSV